MSHSVWVRTVVATLVLVAPSLAQAQATQGDREVQVSGNLFQTVGGEAGLSMGNFIFGLGYFITDRMQIAVQPILTISSFSTEVPQFNSRGVITGTTSERQTDADLGISTKVLRFYGESSARMKPYLGGTFIIQSLKNAGDSSFVAGNFGVKNYLTEKAALDFNGSYGFSLTDPGSGQLLQVSVGITYIF